MSMSLRYLCLLVPWTAWLAAGAAAQPTDPPPSAAELDQRFEELMTGARLEGKFTVLVPDGESQARDDLYMVSDLARGEGSTWIFTARMSYGDQMEVAIPIPVDVLWAGDTPMLTMTDQTIEGMGTFTVRILIHGDRYAGTWQHGPVGGHMWGRLVKGEAAATAAEARGGQELESGAAPPR